MSSLFDDPSSGERLDLQAVKGSLLLVYPKELREGIQTALGSKDAIESDVHVLDGKEAGKVYRSVFIFPLVLQGQLRGNVGTGRPNLGRLGQKPPARPGQNPAWALETASAADKELATKYITNLPVAVPAAAPDPWGGSTPPF